MITVNFYNFSKKDKSTAQPGTSPVALQCALKEPCSVIRPSLQLKFDGYPGYNYCYIPEFGRYYWLDDWVWNRGLWESDLTVDALASFKTEIGGSSLYVLRAAYEKDGLITDTFYPMKNEYVSETATGQLVTPGTGGYYVVGVIGKVSSTSDPTGGITYLVMASSAFTEFRNALFADDLAYAYAGQTEQDGGLTSLGTSFAKLLFDPFQYIVSVCWTPIMPSIASIINAWNVGFWVFTTRSGMAIMDPKSYPGHTSISLTIPKRSDARGLYTNCAPFTELMLYIPTVGMIPIDTTKCLSAERLNVHLYCDALSQTSKVKIFASHGDTAELLSCHDAGFVVPVQLAQSGVTVAGSAVNAIGAIATTAGGVAAAVSGDVAQGISAANAAISSPLGIFQPHVQSIGSNAGYTFFSESVVLYARFYQIADDDNDHHGRPLCRIRTLSSLPGYQQILDGDVVSSRATAQELRDIKAALESGYFYE